MRGLAVHNMYLPLAHMGLRPAQSTHRWLLFSFLRSAKIWFRSALGIDIAELYSLVASKSELCGGLANFPGWLLDGDFHAPGLA